MNTTAHLPGIVHVNADKNGDRNNPISVNKSTGQIMSAFFPNDVVAIEVIAHKNKPNLVAFTGRKGFNPIRVPGTEFAGWRTFRKEVRIMSKNGTYNIPFHDGSGNSLRYLVIDESGNIRITEMAVVTEQKDVFVTKQTIYSAQLYRDGEKIVCNAPLAEWPEMVAFATGVFIKQNGGPTAITLLEPVEKMEPQPPLPEVSGNTGAVKFYSAARGAGAVQTDQGLVKLHFSQVKVTNPDQPRRAIVLERGQLLTFEGLRTPKGQTEFRHEIVGATLIIA